MPLNGFRATTEVCGYGSRLALPPSLFELRRTSRLAGTTAGIVEALEIEIVLSSSLRTQGPIRCVGCVGRCRSTAFAQQPRSVVMGPGSRLRLRSSRLRRTSRLAGTTAGIVEALEI